MSACEVSLRERWLHQRWHAGQLPFGFGPPASPHAAAPDSDSKTERRQEAGCLMDATSRGGNWMRYSDGDRGQLFWADQLH